MYPPVTICESNAACYFLSIHKCYHIDICNVQKTVSVTVQMLRFQTKRE